MNRTVFSASRSTGTSRLQLSRLNLFNSGARNAAQQRPASPAVPSAGAHTDSHSNDSEVAMSATARNLVLTESQAACLTALRDGKKSMPAVAIQAKLDLIKTAKELGE